MTWARSEPDSRPFPPAVQWKLAALANAGTGPRHQIKSIAPKPLLRRAAGAGVEGEIADRATVMPAQCVSSSDCPKRLSTGFLNVYSNLLAACPASKNTFAF